MKKNIIKIYVKQNSGYICTELELKPYINSTGAFVALNYLWEILDNAQCVEYCIRSAAGVDTIINSLGINPQHG